ncbi:hypothetical protein HRbin06_00144 [archaeon HR06]|nr:hypothetical protein HRbin06_00144 [archaeon HR06]
MSQLNTSYWVFSVTPENWQIARQKKIWAVRSKNITQKVRKGDFIILYVNGTESFCTIIETLEDWYQATEVVWADEMEERIIKYPYQIKVRIVQEGLANVKELVQKLSFIKNKQKWGVYVQGTPANMGRPIPESDYQIIQNAMRLNPLPGDISSLLKRRPKIAKGTTIEEKELTVIPKHNEIRDMLLEIGKIEGKIAEVEYPIDNLRLDVVWKTIPTGNPKWAFEVQLAGNFYEALTKLKHAWDKWNSKPFLVTTEAYMVQARMLLEGSFHEMKDDARIVHWEKIVKLYQLLKDVNKIKSEIRL